MLLLKAPRLTVLVVPSRVTLPDVKFPEVKSVSCTSTELG